MDTLSILKRLVDRHGPIRAATMIGVQYPTVWRWLNGKHRISPGMERLVRLAGASNESADLESKDEPRHV